MKNCRYVTRCYAGAGECRQDHEEGFPIGFVTFDPPLEPTSAELETIRRFLAVFHFPRRLGADLARRDELTSAAKRPKFNRWGAR